MGFEPTVCLEMNFQPFNEVGLGVSVYELSGCGFENPVSVTEEI